MNEVEYMDLMKSRHISADRVSSSATCLRCCRKAWRRLQITSGSRHNQEGIYCWNCGKEYISMIGALDEYQPKWQASSTKDGQARLSTC